MSFNPKNRNKGLPSIHLHLVLGAKRRNLNQVRQLVKVIARQPDKLRVCYKPMYAALKLSNENVVLLWTGLHLMEHNDVVSFRWLHNQFLNEFMGGMNSVLFKKAVHAEKTKFASLLGRNRNLDKGDIQLLGGNKGTAVLAVLRCLRVVKKTNARDIFVVATRNKKKTVSKWLYLHFKKSISPAYHKKVL